MPKLDGLEHFAEQRERRAMRVLLMSGTGGVEPPDGIRFFVKPFQIEEIRIVLRHSFDPAPATFLRLRHYPQHPI